MGSRRKKSEEKSESNLVMVMTVSLFIILLAFFILLNSIAVIDEKRKLAALGSLLQSFGVLSGGHSIIEGNNDNMVLPELQMNNDEMDFSDLFIGEENLSRDIRIESDQKKSIIRIPAHVLFEGQKAVIKLSAYVFLEKVCKIIKKCDDSVDIVGHMDNVPIDEDNTFSNRELSAIRALKLLKFFIKHGDISSNRLNAYGWGEYRPVYSNKTKETRRLNRRIDIIFIHEKSDEKPKGIFTFKDFFFKVFE